jgi:hypothetical protein
MELSGSNRKRADLTHREKQQGPPVEPISLDELKQRVQESDLEHIVPPAEKRRSGKKASKR